MFCHCELNIPNISCQICRLIRFLSCSSNMSAYLCSPIFYHSKSCIVPKRDRVTNFNPWFQTHGVCLLFYHSHEIKKSVSGETLIESSLEYYHYRSHAKALSLLIQASCWFTSHHWSLCLGIPNLAPYSVGKRFVRATNYSETSPELIKQSIGHCINGMLESKLQRSLFESWGKIAWKLRLSVLYRKIISSHVPILIPFSIWLTTWCRIEDMIGRCLSRPQIFHKIGLNCASGTHRIKLDRLSLSITIPGYWTSIFKWLIGCVKWISRDRAYTGRNKSSSYSSLLLIILIW